jgi:HEPN domain-containing protein
VESLIQPTVTAKLFMPRPDADQSELIQSWIKRAEEDWKVAKTLLKSEGDFANTVCFHCQQVAEKYLKALLTYWQTPFSKTHDLSELLKVVSKRKAVLALHLESIERLSPYAVATRYPDGIHDLGQNDAQEALKLAELVRKEVKKILKTK